MELRESRAELAFGECGCLRIHRSCRCVTAEPFQLAHRNKL